MRSRLSKVLIAALLITAVELAAADRPAVREQAQRIETGRYVEVRQAGEPGKLRGELERVTSDGVVLRVVDRSEELRKTVPFEQIKSIRPVRSPAEKREQAQRFWQGVLAVAYAFTYALEP